MKHFYSIDELPDFKLLVNRGIALNKGEKNEQIGVGKTLVILFFSPSLRTRLSTQKAGMNIGMQVICMTASEGYEFEYEFGVKMDGTTAEHVKEAANVISQYADVIAVRSFSQGISYADDTLDLVLQSFMKYATVPVVNLESALYHPLQGLADAITIEEIKKKKCPRVVLTWAPHPKALPLAVPTSFIHAMQRIDVDLLVTHPETHHIPEELIGKIDIEYNQRKAFQDADYIYAKNWMSVDDYGKSFPQFDDWIVTEEKMKSTNLAHFMHCLPIRRNVIAVDAVLDAPRSLIYQQAKNRTTAAEVAFTQLLS